MSTFAMLMHRANVLRRIDRDAPIRFAWWTGYIRGLRRAHHGEQFGTEPDHELYLSAVDSTDPARAALGRGYRAGLTLTVRHPE